MRRQLWRSHVSSTNRAVRRHGDVQVVELRNSRVDQLSREFSVAVGLWKLEEGSRGSDWRGNQHLMTVHVSGSVGDSVASGQGQRVEERGVVEHGRLRSSRGHNVRLDWDLSVEHGTNRCDGLRCQQVQVSNDVQRLAMGNWWWRLFQHQLVDQLLISFGRFSSEFLIGLATFNLERWLVVCRLRDCSCRRRRLLINADLHLHFRRSTLLPIPLVEVDGNRILLIQMLREDSQTSVSILEVHRLQHQSAFQSPGTVSTDDGVGSHRHHVSACLARAVVVGTARSVSFEHDLLAMPFALSTEQCSVRAS